MKSKEINSAGEAILDGSVGVIPTDTIYGVVASVFNEESIERVYKETGRPTGKPFIILVSGYEQIEDLKIAITDKQRAVLQTLWPGPVSVILDTYNEAAAYLHRGKNSLAVRLPGSKWLKELVERTGPMIATSANKAGLPTPDKLEEIKRQLPNLDFYYDGPVGKTASKLVSLDKDGNIKEFPR